MLKKLFCLLGVISLLIPVIGCHETSSPTSTTNSPPPVITDTVASYPFDFDLELSRIPQPGETAELTFSAQLAYPYLLSTDKPKEGLTNGKAWLDFYWINLEGSYDEAKHGVLVSLSEVLVTGKTDIQGDVRRPDSLKCTVKLPREGIWKIVGNLLGEGWQSPETITKMYVIADGYTFNYKIYPNPDLASSPLAYLMYFPYGQISYRPLNDTTDQVVLETDISKAPKPGEQATVTVKITSLYDFADFSSQVKFFKNRDYPEVPAKDLYISGDLSWSGDLKAGQPVLYSADIKFPEEGEWKILSIGNYREREFLDYIPITISNINSFYGWKPLPKIESSKPDPNQAALNLDTGETVFPYKATTIEAEQSSSTLKQSTSINWIFVMVGIAGVCVLGGVLSYLLIMQKRRRNKMKP